MQHYIWRHSRFLILHCENVWKSNIFRHLLIVLNTTTPNMSLIHTWLRYSKLNKGEICGLKSHLLYVHSSQNIILKSIHGQKGHFYYLIYNFVIKPPFYEVKNIFRKRLCAWRDFIKKNYRPLFAIIFKPNILILDMYIVHFEYENEVISGVLVVKAGFAQVDSFFLQRDRIQF